MASNNNSKQQRNSGSEPSRRPFGKTRSAGSPITTSAFPGSTPRGASGRPCRASVSSTCSPLPSSPIRRTRSSPSARPRRPWRLAITKPAKRRTFRRRVNPGRLFSWTPCQREDGTRFQKGSRRRILQQTLPWGASLKGGTAQSEAGFFARSPVMSRRARGSAHEIRLFPLVSQRPIIVSIRLRRLYPFRIIQDREAALQQAPPAHSMKMMGVALGRIRVAGAPAEQLSCQRV